MRILKEAIAFLVSIVGFFVFGAFGLLVLAIGALVWPAMIGLVVTGLIAVGIKEYFENKSSNT
jgi:hypothetical protein